MFYITSISGSLHPFDPRSMQIANVTPPVSAISQVAASNEVLATVAAKGESSAALPSADLNTKINSTALTNDDALMFDGHVIPSSRELAGVKNAINIARAGAAMAYRIQDSEESIEKSANYDSLEIESISSTQSLANDKEGTANRVTPIDRRPKSQYQPKPKEKKKVVIASDLMNFPVFTLTEDAFVEEAQKAFVERRYRHIPITSAAGKLVGIISDRDFFGKRSRPAQKNPLVKQIMVSNVLTAHPQTEIREIAEVMISHRIGCMPIVDESAFLLGIITRSDILRAIVNRAAIELWT